MGRGPRGEPSRQRGARSGSSPFQPMIGDGGLAAGAAAERASMISDTVLVVLLLKSHVDACRSV